MERQRYFPNEVWLQIFAHLQFRLEPFKRPKILYPSFFTNRLTLAKIARVSKNFNSMATPLLYHTLPINSFPFSRFGLARTLIARPELAQLVQEADITAENVRETDLLDALTAALSTCSEPMVPLFEFLLGRCKRKECSAADQIAFFLIMLPNLRVAELEVHMSSKPMLEMLAAWPSSLLPKVRDLRLRSSSVDPWVRSLAKPLPSTDNVVPTANVVRDTGLDYLIQLPSVRTFHGAGILWREYRGPALDLRHLVLCSAQIGTTGILNVLSHCPHLETLQINWKAPYWLEFCMVGDSLRSLGRNLEKLDLGPFPRRPTWNIGPLCTLTRLKELTLPWDVMVGTPRGHPSGGSAEGHTSVLPQGIPRLVDLLPDSLEHLCLYLREADLESWQLLELVRSVRFSKLRSVRVARDRRANIYDVSQTTFRQDLSRIGWALRKYKQYGWSSVRDRFIFYGIALEKKGT